MAKATARTIRRDEVGQTAEPVGLPRLEDLAPPEASKQLELRRFRDPNVVEAAVPEPMLAYRCAGPLTQSFGVSRPEMILPGPHRIPGYLVCVHGRSYIQPLLLASAAGRAGVVLELRIPAGTPALWIAGNGDPSTVNGADLICLDHVAIELIGHRIERGSPTLELQVHQS